MIGFFPKGAQVPKSLLIRAYRDHPSGNKLGTERQTAWDWATLLPWWLERGWRKTQDIWQTWISVNLRYFRATSGNFGEFPWMSDPYKWTIKQWVSSFVLHKAIGNAMRQFSSDSGRKKDRDTHTLSAHKINKSRGFPNIYWAGNLTHWFGGSVIHTLPLHNEALLPCTWVLLNGSPPSWDYQVTVKCTLLSKWLSPESVTNELGWAP
jgi:hypothetical protein